MAHRPQPFGNTVFCDDVRIEVDGKVSLIGVYNGLLIINAEPPVQVGKFGFFVTIFEPKELVLGRDFPIKVNVYMPGSGNAPTFIDEISSPSEEMRETLRNAAVPIDIEGTALVRSVVNLQVSPLLLQETGIIRSRADYRGQTIKLGSLRVVTTSQLSTLGQQAVPQPD